MGLVRAALAALVLLGPLLWMHRTCRLAAGWHPVVVLSGWAVTVLLAGIGGSLVAGVVIVVVAGLGLLAHELLRHRVEALRAVREPAYLVLGVTAVLLALVLQGSIVLHYDNFSHWALVVKVMLETGGLPTSAQPVVDFTTYPLGASSLAYLFNRLLGRSESASLLGHDLWLVSCALPLVTAAGRRWLPGVLVYGVGALALLTLVTSPRSLLVDTLIGGLGACVLILVLLERREIVRHPWPLAVLGSALIAVKSSGAFFVAVITLLAVVIVWRQRGRLGAALVAAWAATAAAPWFVWWLWGQHVARTFPESSEAKHSVSVERFDRILGEKSPEEVRSILESLALTTLQNWTTVLLVLAMVLAGSLAVRTGAAAIADNRRTLVVMTGTVVLWVLSLALMYLFSMPTGEALKLAGYRRYMGTMHLAVLLVTLMLVSSWAATAQRRDARQLVTAGLALTLPVSMALQGIRDLEPVEPRAQERPAIEQGLRQARAGADDQVCVLLEESDGGYRAWMVRYLLLSPTVRSHVLLPDDPEIPRASECDVFVIDDPRATTAMLVREAGFALEAGAELPVVVGR